MTCGATGACVSFSSSADLSRILEAPPPRLQDLKGLLKPQDTFRDPEEPIDHLGLIGNKSGPRRHLVGGPDVQPPAN